MTAPPITIAQISDLHIKRPGELAYRKVDTAAALVRCVAHLNTLQPPPAMVVASGDLVDRGLPEEYAHLKQLLAPLALPLAVIPGNHDARAPLRAAFPGQPYADPDGALNLSIALGPFDLVLLDSSVPGQPHGLLDAGTLAWLDQTLARSTDRPALVFLHHPPFATAIAHMDRQALRNPDDLAAVIGRHRRTRLIAAGHVHRAVLTSFAGIPATICPVPNHAVDLDLTEARVPSLRIEPPGFHLHVWLEGPSDQGRLVTHFVPIGDFPGPYPFFATDGQLL
jgi:3',5'-cyclic AMP phosphodiesterase CpdA